MRNTDTTVVISITIVLFTVVLFKKATCVVVYPVPNSVQGSLETHHKLHKSQLPAILEQEHSNNTINVKGSHPSNLPIRRTRASELQLPQGTLQVAST
jgi:hypothetical protein